MNEYTRVFGSMFIIIVMLMYWAYCLGTDMGQKCLAFLLLLATFTLGIVFCKEVIFRNTFMFLNELYSKIENGKK